MKPNPFSSFLIVTALTAYIESVAVEMERERRRRPKKTVEKRLFLENEDRDTEIIRRTVCGGKAADDGKDADT